MMFFAMFAFEHGVQTTTAISSLTELCFMLNGKQNPAHEGAVANAKYFKGNRRVSCGSIKPSQDARIM
jgi:hypothetical protein